MKTNFDKSGIGANAPDVAATPDMSPLSFDSEYNTRLLLIRHGESFGNMVRRFLGHTNFGLSERGRTQAERTAEFLCDMQVDAIYSSDLSRAYETATPIAERHSMNIITDKELREIHVGSWEGLLVVELQEWFGKYFTEEWSENFGTFRGAPGGESVQHLRERIGAALLKIARENVGKTVLVVFHAAAIRAAFGEIAGIAPENVGKELPFPSNASISVVYYDGDRLVAGEYSHDAHLADL